MLQKRKRKDGIGMRKRTTKIASLLLSLAMTVTMLPTQYVYAGNGDAGARTPMAVSDDDAKLPEPMVQFTFDDDVATDVKGVAKATIGGGTAEAIEDDGRGDKVLSLKDKGYLKITNKNDEKSPLVGKKAITLSFWSKGSITTANAGWVYFIRKSSATTSWGAQFYLGLQDGGGSVKTERYWGNGNNGRVNGAAGASGFEVDSWKQVTVVLDTESTTVYVNGKEQASQGEQNKTGDAEGAHILADYLTDGNVFEIGKGDWGEEYFTGKLDDFTIYDSALTPEQVNASYLNEVTLQSMGVFAEGESDSFARTKLTLPETVNETAFAWTSGNTEKIANDGTVKAWDGSEVTMTATANIPGYGSWSRAFPVKLARKVKVSYTLKGTDTALKEEVEEYYKSSLDSYPLKDEDKVWSDAATKKTYVLSQADSALQMGDGKTEVKLVYTEDEVETVSTQIEPVTVRVGMIPQLPTTVKAVFTSGQERDVAVAWDMDAIKTACETAGKKTITGGVGAKLVTVELTVKDKEEYLLAGYTFDEEDTENGWANSKGGANAVLDGTGKVTTVPGLKGNAIELPGGVKGTAAIKLPDDLFKTGEGEYADDFTISMFIKNPGNGNSFAMSLLGDTSDNYLGFINRTGGNGNAVQLECKKKDSAASGCAANGKALTDVWEHFAIVVNGSEGITKIYKNGKVLATGTLSFKPSTLKQQRNFLGRAEWPDSDYKGIYDEFKAYSIVLTDEEIQSLCDEVLYTEQMNKALNGLETLKTWDGKDADPENLTDDLKLPETGDGDSVSITWESTNNDVINVVTPGDGIVTQPYGEGAQDAEVTLTATIKIRDYEKTGTKTFTFKVPKREGADLKPLRRAIAAAQETYEEARHRSNIYVTSSLNAKKKAIDDANALLEKTAPTEAEIEEMISELKKPLALKNLDELSSLLTAWYPLDKDAKDASGNEADATAASTINFTKENGAVMPGCTDKANILKNIITLPTDKLTVTDQMTFSFRVNSAGGKNFFGFGSMLSDKGGDAHHLIMRSELQVSMSNDGWNAHRGVNAEITPNEDHDVTVVLNGKSLTLYVDGKKEGTAATDLTMTEAWNTEGGRKYAYLGNCSYAHNNNENDMDFKGSVRDVRIYNAALEDKQVAEIEHYRESIPMSYAKADVIAAMAELGAKANADGTYALDIIQTSIDEDGKLALPAKGYGEKATVTWTAEGEGKDAIDTTTNVVTIPAQGAPVKSFTLKATVVIGDQTETLTYVCRAYYKNLTLDTSELDALITEMKAYKESDYTKASFAAFTTILNEVYDAVPTLNSQEEVTTQINKLKNAKKDVLVDISELRAKIESLEDEYVGLDENLYTSASCKAFEDKLAAAKAILEKENATKSEVDDQMSKLPASAVDGLTVCGSKKVLEDAIAEAEDLAVYKEAYTNWATVEAALVTAKAELDKRLESYEEAAAALNNVVDALVIKDDHKLTETLKEELEKKLEQAKAENLKSSNYTTASWKTYKDALDKLEEVLGGQKVTKDEAEAAAIALEAARAALVPVTAQVPTAVKKQEFNTAYEQATQAASGMRPESYTTESWNRYQNALAGMKAIADRLAAEKNNVTKDEIDGVIAEMKAATEALVLLNTVDKSALEAAITGCANLKATDYIASTWNAFQAALNTAKAVAAKDDATQAEVDAALADLNAKKAALKKPVPVSSIKLTAVNKNIMAGKKTTVKANVAPADATNKAITFKSSNAKFATVNPATGVVTTKKAGAGKKVTITATANDGSGKVSNKITVKIMKYGVKKVSFKKKTLSVKAGKKVTLKPTITLTNKKAKKSQVNKTLSYKSSNTKWATVTSKGKVTTKKAGKGKTVKITVTSTDGTNKKAVVKIKIKK